MALINSQCASKCISIFNGKAFLNGHLLCICGALKKRDRNSNHIYETVALGLGY